MELLLTVIGLALVVAVAGWWLLRRRTPPPEEDEWTLPPEADAINPGTVAASPPMLDRTMLLHDDRVLDPSKWDNTPDANPDGTDDGGEEDLPRFFDREYLRQQERKDAPEA